VVLEGRLQALVYSIIQDDTLWGPKAGMLNNFFVGLQVTTTFTLAPMKGYLQFDSQSLTRHTWSIQAKLYQVIMEALNTKISLTQQGASQNN
jgi:hypothetical protein